MKKPKMETYLNKISQLKNLPSSRISVFIAILQLWKDQKHQNPFHITRKKVMRRSSIKSIVTYHKCISDLKDRRILDYKPSFHPKKGSRVFLN